MVRARGRREHDARVARVRDDRHLVLRPEPTHQHAHRALHERELVPVGHRAGHVEQEDEVRGRPVCTVEVARLEADPYQAVRGLPGTRRGLDAHRERRAVGRGGICVREVVDELLQAHRVGGRERFRVEEPADVRVRRRVHVDGEGGHGFHLRLAKAVLRDAVVALGVERPRDARGARRARSAGRRGARTRPRRAGLTRGEGEARQRQGRDPYPTTNEAS